MSSVGTTARESAMASTQTSVSAGRAVFLLAFAVLLGVVLLQGLDESKIATTSSGSRASSPADQAAPASNLPPASVEPARPPSQVKILVANGVGVNGAASKVAGRLQPAGYELMKPGNTVNREEISRVEYIPGYAAEAQAVAISLGLPATSVLPLPAQTPVTNLQGSQVLVIVGNDLANAPQASGAGAPTNSAAPTTALPATSPLSGPLTSVTGVVSTLPAVNPNVVPAPAAR